MLQVLKEGHSSQSSHPVRARKSKRMMGPLESPSLSPSAPRPTSPPSARPPPPPLVSYHLPLPSSAPPLPPPCHPRGALRMPHRHGTPPGATSPWPRTSRPARGGSFVEYLVPARGFPMTAPIRGDVSGENLAGVPPEMLPLKKRLVRYHPYEAASTIQDMTCHGHGGFGRPPVLVTAEGDASGRGDGRQERDDGLRAELLRLRISRSALVLTKRLTPSDRSCHKGRLLLPESLVKTSPLLSMLTAGERGLVFSGERGGLPVPAFDRLGRPYRMVLKRDRVTRRTYSLMGHWSLFVSRHGMCDGDTVEVRAFRPPSWQARLDRCGEGGLGMALLHCRSAATVKGRAWSNRERDAADGLLLLDANARQDGGREGGGL